jgi:hypothetical protein
MMRKIDYNMTRPSALVADVRVRVRAGFGTRVDVHERGSRQV